MERMAPGAFAGTIADNRDHMRVTFNHGKDPSLGDKVLGIPSVLAEDGRGVRYEVPLFDTAYNRELAPGSRPAPTARASVSTSPPTTSRAR